ncbi:MULTISPECIES: alpha/beta fold hydrolase [unclassified Nocardioides]|uniref:alpha/beta fold hydrolase n=1 Tax=unclassified Nocardioides TaxID=2615069 RepID=UPI0030152E54
MTTHHFRAFDGVALSARVEGAGDRAVLQLSGGPGMVNYLPAPPDGFPARVVSPDPRGVGASAGGPHGLERAIADLEALRRSLGLQDWDVVAGHSSGADLGLAYAAEHPHSVARLVSVCGTGLQDDRSWHAAYEAARDTEPDLGLPYDEAVHRALLDDWRRWIREPDLFERLRRIDEPPRFVVAELDIRPSWPVAQLASLMSERPLVVTGVGHDFWHTHPEHWWALVAPEVGRPPGEPDPGEAATHVRERLDIIGPLVEAVDDAHAILDLVLGSADVREASERLVRERGLTEIAAAAVLDLQVRRFAARQRHRLGQERDDLLRDLAEITRPDDDVRRPGREAPGAT